MTKKANANQPFESTTDLTADDFGKIRGNVRAAMLARNIPVEQLNQLMTAYRTMQPIFTAATKWYKDPNDSTRAKAKEAADKATEYLLGTNLPDAQF